MNANKDQAIVDMLRAAARATASERELTVLHDAAIRVSDWERAVREAESHAVAPLLFTHLRSAGFELPVAAKRQLYALVQRHRWANATRAEVLGEIIDACAARGIDLLVLKGNYLAYTVYPDPSLRTMSDIDLLAPPARAMEVQALLRDLGFNVPEKPLSRFMSEHHHLPGASLLRDGLNVSVEVHHDALSGDSPESITHDNLTAPPCRFTVAGRDAYALGHQDQLRHLYHHMSEPAALLKLIWCADIIAVADHYRDEIDWDRLRREYPRVCNAIRLTGYVTPLPETLLDYLAAPPPPAPAGTGTSILPLSTIQTRPSREALHLLFYPSDWWLRMYYGTAPESSLIFTRWLRHPVRVAQWIGRRVLAWWHARQRP